MHLMAYYGSGPTASNRLLGAWRDPSSDAECCLSFEYYERVARALERACFDGVFFVDVQGIGDVYQG